MTSKRAVLVFIATALQLGVSSLAYADSPTPPETASRHMVDVVIAGDPDEARAVESSLRELLRRVALDLRVATVERLPADHDPSAADVAVRAWIDLRADNGALIEVSDARVDRSIERRVLAQEGSRAVLLEDVAHVVQAAAESIASNAPPPAPTPPPPPPPVVAPAPRPSAEPPASHPPVDTPAPPAGPAPWSFAIASFFTGGAYAHESGVVPGAGAGVRFESGPFGLWGFGAYHASFGDDAPPVPLRASVWSVRVLPTYELVDASRFLLELGGGPGLDIFAISPGATGAGVMTLDAKRTEASPILSAMLAAHVSIGTSARVFLAATVDWDLVPRRYVVAPAGPDRTLLTPLTVRPSLSIGFSFDVFRGEARR